MTNNVRSLWLYVFLVLQLLSGSASAQEPAAAPAPPPKAAKPPAAEPEPASEESPPTAAASTVQESAIEPGVVRLLLRQRDALGRRCELQQSAKSGLLRLLACGPAGLWIVRLLNESGDSAVLASQQDLGGKVQRFFQADGRLWVEISSVRAQEVGIDAAVSDQSAPPPPPPTAAAPPPVVAHAPPAPAPSISEGRVVSQTDAEILVATGGVPPIRPGDHIAFIDSVRHPDGEPNEQQIVAVGEVTRSWLNGRARVSVGTNEIVPLTAAARSTLSPTTAGSFAPPRAAGIWELGFLARPFLVLDDLGFGAVLDAYVGYHWQAPFHVEASFTPLALGAARAGGVGATGAFVSGAFDSRLFEVGLGIGAQTVNAPDFALQPGSGLLVAQQLRVGARDGAHLRFLSYVALFHSSFQFSSLRIEAQIPLGARTWLRLAGAGGTVGIGFGEVGLRVLMSGNGGAGSFFFTTVAGWANLFRNCTDVPRSDGASSSCGPANYSGPMLGGGGEFRL